jgi:hypothetical protein
MCCTDVLDTGFESFPVKREGFGSSFEEGKVGALRLLERGFGEATRRKFSSVKRLVRRTLLVIGASGDESRIWDVFERQGDFNGSVLQSPRSSSIAIVLHHRLSTSKGTKHNTILILKRTWLFV